LAAISAAISIGDDAAAAGRRSAWYRYRGWREISGMLRVMAQQNIKSASTAAEINRKRGRNDQWRYRKKLFVSAERRRMSNIERRRDRERRESVSAEKA
jgi:hypothetical protein